MGALAHGVLARPCQADDGSIEAVGGTGRAMRNHKTIRMVSEFVHVRLSRQVAEVECVFLLHNRGPATSVTVGFPCSSGGADVTEPVPFKEFHSWVDGMPVKVRVLPDSTNRPDGNGFGSWWVKDIHFGANETRSVRDVYLAEPGKDFLFNRSFEYILETGASWAGPIGTGDIVVTLDGIPESTLQVEPAPTSRSKSELRWHFSKLEPGYDSGFERITIFWPPAGSSEGQR